MQQVTQAIADYIETGAQFFQVILRVFQQNHAAVSRIRGTIAFTPDIGVGFVFAPVIIATMLARTHRPYFNVFHFNTMERDEQTELYPDASMCKTPDLKL